ncbi:MAG TPA: branched-chain amino acid ABC transporter permease [Streptosporangiaceae bacterium]|nr:branched-chain amino acid ABC transporter permease [Streptosporangiaceae bacterium]
MSPPGIAPDVRVTRSRRSALWPVLGAVVVIAVLAYLPYVVYAGTTSLLVNFFILLIMASLWNLLAGYAGLVSVGQQAFIGLGSYFVLIVGLHGIDPFIGLPVAALGSGVVGLVVWWLLSRLRTGYFAIATWVIASICYLVVIRFASLGGGTGEPLPGLPSISNTLLNAYTYWVALAVAVIVLVSIYVVLRGRLGLVLTAVRDDETGARSIGARVSRAQLLVFVIAAVGCGAAGGLELISQPFVQPTAAFSVQWTAEMIFATLIGGIGTIEGPILGTIVFFALQQWLSSYGTWYLIVLGAVAMTVAIWAPRGLWGLIAERLHLRLFPVGYWVWPAERGAGSGSARLRLPRLRLRRGGAASRP